MSKVEKALSHSQAARILSDGELEAVNGGITDGCIRPSPITIFYPEPEPDGFRDLFAKYTIGRYLPV
jgi:hypothetical protein